MTESADEGGTSKVHKTTMKIPTVFTHAEGIVQVSQSTTPEETAGSSSKHRKKHHKKHHHLNQKHASLYVSPRESADSSGGESPEPPSGRNRESIKRRRGQLAIDLAAEAQALKAITQLQLQQSQLQSASQTPPPTSSSSSLAPMPISRAQQTALLTERRMSIDSNDGNALQHVYRRESGSRYIKESASPSPSPSTTPNSPAAETSMNSCDCCGDPFAMSSTILKCVVCGYKCHIECQYDKKALACLPPAVGMRKITRTSGIGLATLGNIPQKLPSNHQLIRPTTSLEKLQVELQQFQEKLTQQLPKIIHCQAVVKGYLTRKIFKDAKKRKHIIEELLTTEHNYTTQLRALITKFMQPLIDRSSSLDQCILPKEIVSNLFLNITEVLEGSEKFAKSLDDIVYSAKNWVLGPEIGINIIKTIPFLLPHIEYSIMFQESLDIYSQCMRIPSFSAWEKQTAKALANEIKGLDLQDLLILPVQRIPRYIILLEDLLSKTSIELHPDSKHLRIAVNCMKQLARFMNERRRKRDTMLQIRKELVGINELLPDNWRYLIRKGPLMFGDHKKHKHDEYAFLFNDVLVLAEISSTSMTTTKQNTTKTITTSKSKGLIANSVPVVYKAVAKVNFCDGCSVEIKQDAKSGMLASSFILNGCSNTVDNANNNFRIFTTIGKEEREQWVADLQDVIQMHAWRHDSLQQSFLDVLRKEVLEYKNYIS